MTLVESRVFPLLQRIRRCDPGRYLSEEDLVEILDNVEQLEREIRRVNDNLAWFRMKLKANADHHGRSFDLDSEFMNQCYSDYKSDLKIYSLKQPELYIACKLRDFGLRKSFIRRAREVGAELTDSIPR